MAQTKKPTKKKTTTKKASDSKAKTSSKKKHPASSTKKPKAPKDAAPEVEVSLDEAQLAEAYVQYVLEPVLVYANDIKNASLRKRVLAWFKKSK